MVDNCIERQIQTDTNLITTRSWVTFPYQEHYCADYATDEFHFSEAHEFRENYFMYGGRTIGEYWGLLYKAVFEREKDLLLPIVDSLLHLKQENMLNRTEFAKVVVAFVQDIPYSYIKPGSECDELEDEQYDCIPNQRYGLLTPIEFLHTLKGDCDTRTLLLYTLFKQLGYSPKIANSEVYLHSMLLLDVPSGGDYLVENNQRYYFVETTYKGWQLGDLPPQYGKKKYWEIVLN